MSNHRSSMSNYFESKVESSTLTKELAKNQVLLQALDKNRAARLEESDGVAIEIYGLKKIKITTQEIKILSIHISKHYRNPRS